VHRATGGIRVRKHVVWLLSEQIQILLSCFFLERWGRGFV
jgi:hypothetical protein